MTKKQSNLYKPTFRLKSANEFYHKGYFLHYINDLVPEVSAELKKLTPNCEELFGEFPVSIETLPDWVNFGVWFNEPDDDIEQRQSWFKITRIFRDCIWKESRENKTIEWLGFLRENDDELKQIHEFQEKLMDETDQYVKSLPEEKLDSLREIFASDWHKPKESLDIQDLQFSYWRRESYWLSENDENYRKQTDLEFSKLEPLIKFQNDFDSLLKKFCLEKEWLAESVFLAIWNGTGKLQMESTFIETFSEELLDEIMKNLGQKKKYFDKMNGFRMQIPLFMERLIRCFSAMSFTKKKRLKHIVNT